MKKQLSLVMFSLLSLGFFHTNTFGMERLKGFFKKKEAPSTPDLEIHAASILPVVAYYIVQVADELQLRGPFDRYTQQILEKMAVIQKGIDNRLSSVYHKMQAPYIKNIIKNLSFLLDEKSDIAQLAQRLKKEIPDQIAESQQKLEEKQKKFKTGYEKRMLPNLKGAMGIPINSKIFDIIGSYIDLQIIQAARTYNDLINNLKKKGVLTTLGLPEKLTFENIYNYAR